MFAGRASFSNERDASTFPRVAHRNHRGTARPDERPNNGKMQRMLGKELLCRVRSLRKEMLSRVQRGAHKDTQKEHLYHQFTGRYTYILLSVTSSIY